jgi:hypothetical protein
MRWSNLSTDAYAPPDERRRLARMVEGPDVTPGERMRGRLVEPEVPVYLEPAFAQPRLF